MSVNPCPYTVLPTPDPHPLAESFREIAVSHLSDNLQRLSGLCNLRRIHTRTRLVGTALTVKVRPGDNLLIYKALTLMRPGHVLVVDGGADTTNALVGELILLYAQQRGCAGFVIDGAVRDTAAFEAADFPCYARGVSHRGPYKLGPGAINVPVTVAGQVVLPGDLLVGDEDGVVSFAADDAPALLQAALRTAAHESAVKAEIANGQVRQSWLDKVLVPAGLAGTPSP